MRRSKGQEAVGMVREIGNIREGPKYIHERSSENRT